MAWGQLTTPGLERIKLKLFSETETKGLTEVLPISHIFYSLQSAAKSEDFPVLTQLCGEEKTLGPQDY